MFNAGLTAIYLDHPYRYRALKMLQDTSKRERGAGEMSVKREIAATQSDAASLLSTTMQKKACVGRMEGAVSPDGVASLENSLGSETVPRSAQAPSSCPPAAGYLCCHDAPPHCAQH